MPSYRLGLDDHGRPQFEEEFSGEHPDDASFRRIASSGTCRGWASLFAEQTAEPISSGTQKDWQLLPGAADLDSRFDAGSARPAPFAFGAGKPA